MKVRYCVICGAPTPRDYNRRRRATCSRPCLKARESQIMRERMADREFRAMAVAAAAAGRRAKKQPPKPKATTTYSERLRLQWQNPEIRAKRLAHLDRVRVRTTREVLLKRLESARPLSLQQRLLPPMTDSQRKDYEKLVYRYRISRAEALRVILGDEVGHHVGGGAA